jgi:heme/copper-type cytochrome/quinol oxidase subunit 3
MAHHLILCKCGHWNWLGSYSKNTRLVQCKECREWIDLATAPRREVKKDEKLNGTASVVLVLIFSAVILFAALIIYYSMMHPLTP